MSSVIKIQGDDQLADDLRDLSLRDQEENQSKSETRELGFGSHGGCCAICLDSIPLQETAMVKDCEHTYCVTCILRWASYKVKPTCPQCKHPFEFLNVHRTLDGSVEDFMFEESVCLLLRASWFEPLFVEERVSDNYDFPDDYIPFEYEDEDDDLEEFYFSNPGIRIGNRRWGDNGYVRSGRRQARPVQHRPNNSQASGSGSGSGSGSSSSSSSREPKGKQVKTNATGRRAKRAMKREAADKAAEAAAAAKREAHLVRLGRK